MFMKRRILLFIIITFYSMDLVAQAKPAYALFTSEGKRTNYGNMVRAAARADMVLFGELHNNPISHWLQYTMTRDLHNKRRLILGAEMFEADNQQALNDYLRGLIDEKALDSLARLWDNYKTDYAPLIEFAKK
jgi:uncharacterized iron-regulated protein